MLQNISSLPSDNVHGLQSTADALAVGVGRARREPGRHAERAPGDALLVIVVLLLLVVLECCKQRVLASCCYARLCCHDGKFCGGFDKILMMLYFLLPRSVTAAAFLQTFFFFLMSFWDTRSKRKTIQVSDFRCLTGGRHTMGFGRGTPATLLLCMFSVYC